MPSGAKKRKAAKKKQQASNNTNTNSNASTNNNSDRSSSGSPLGIDDPRSQDERDSDGGEVGSPASQDNQNNQHPFKETSEESEKRDPSPVRSFDTENRSVEEVSRDIEGTKEVRIEDDVARDLKSEEDSGSQSISIKHIELVKESHDGSSSSSSSSDDESQVTEKKSDEAENDSTLGATPLNGENKPVGSFPVEIIQVSEKASFGEADNPVVDTAVIGDLVKPLATVTEEVIHVPEGDSVESSLVPDVVETRLEENEESKKTEENIFPIVEDNVGAPSKVVESVTNGNESKVLPTSDSSVAETNNGAANIRDSKIPDSYENKPPLPSAPQVAQRSFWMSCCGLLDVLTGSGR